MIPKFYIRRAILTAFISVSLISIGAALSATSALQKYEALEYEALTASKESETNEIFFVRSHGEVIGVFDDRGELLYTVDVYIKTLPVQDRAILNKGITATSREELYEILGDYDA